MNIRKATLSDATLLAKMHVAVFPGFFLSSLGESFLRKYYMAALRLPETICFFAEENGEVCGYILGRANARGYLKRVILSAPIMFVCEGIRLLFIKPLALIRLLRNIEKKKSDAEFTDKQDYAEIGLVGVLPQHKSKGIGRTLLLKLIDVLKSQGVTKLSLTTDAEGNDSTLAAYKSWGFDILYKFITYPNRQMYRLIKDIAI